MLAGARVAAGPGVPDAGAVEVLAIEPHAMLEVLALNRRLDRGAPFRRHGDGAVGLQSACLQQARIDAFDLRKIERQRTVEIAAFAWVKTNEPLGREQR